MEQMQSSTIKAIVTEDFRAAAVFERHGLDFCCRGGVTIDEACRDAKIDPATVYADLAGLQHAAAAAVPDYAAWEPGRLIDRIVSVHHAYVREAIPVMTAHTRKVARVHGQNHPEVITIAEEFEKVAAEMMQHMFKEERILFPYIRMLAEARNGSQAKPFAPFGTVRNPISMMEEEHRSAGDAMATIRSLSSGYAPPDDACTTYRVTYQELQRFELDLHEHVHLENNILFPAAIAME